MKRFSIIFAALALAVPSMAAAQITANDPVVRQAGMTFGQPGAAATSVDAAHPLPVATAQPAATSTACTVTVTTSTSTPSGCSTVSGSAGTYVIGGFTPQIGYGVRVVLTGTWTGTVSVGTSASGCSTFNPLTVGGQAWGVFTANANEMVDVPATTVSGLVYCLNVAVTSGTLIGALRN